MARSYRATGSGDKAFTVRVSGDLYDRLMVAQTVTGQSLSALAEAAFAAYLASPPVAKAAKNWRETYTDTINQLAGGQQ